MSPQENRGPHDHGFALQAKGHGKNLTCLKLQATQGSVSDGIFFMTK